MSEKELKLTDLDYATGSHRLQMMKAALPYMGIREQRALSMFIKWSELRRTMDFFQENEDGMMSICSVNEEQTSPMDMLMALKPFANSREQEIIEMIGRILQSQVTGGKGASPGSGWNSPIPFDQIISMLSPDQQARFETLQMMMQALGQM